MIFMFVCACLRPLLWLSEFFQGPVYDYDDLAYDHLVIGDALHPLSKAIIAELVAGNRIPRVLITTTFAMNYYEIYGKDVIVCNLSDLNRDGNLYHVVTPNLGSCHHNKNIYLLPSTERVWPCYSSDLKMEQKLIHELRQYSDRVISNCTTQGMSAWEAPAGMLYALWVYLFQPTPATMAKEVLVCLSWQTQDWRTRLVRWFHH